MFRTQGVLGYTVRWNCEIEYAKCKISKEIAAEYINKMSNTYTRKYTVVHLLSKDKQS